MRLIAAALAGGGAGLALLVLSWWPGILVAMLVGGRVGPVAGFVVLGLVCGLAAGCTGTSFSEGWPVWVALGAWAVWAVGIAILVGTQITPTVFGWATLPAGLLGTVVGTGAWRRGGATRRPSGLLRAGLLGALGAFAVLTLGVAALGWAAAFGLRPTGVTVDYYLNVYLPGMEAALWAVIVLAAALSAAIPVAAAGWIRRNPAPAAALALVLFLALGALAGFVFDFYLACTVGTPLPPFAWLTRGAQC